MNKIELLLPARDAAIGQVAVNHGADAVYIGATRFGARQAAGNNLLDIENLVRYAHLYGAKVYVTVNTVLYDSELRAVEQLTHELYNIGVDALIVQDMGILKLHLPPIALHASTQCHNADLQQIRFLEKAGFQRAILAREMDLEQVRCIHEQSAIQLEMFVHGALCVCYSGQCYMSRFVTGRSGNRGECAQMCRLRYDLQDAEGKTLVRNKHLLSLLDMNRSESLLDILQAGVCSLKVEGRLKDANYVKNITGFYRRKLDAVFSEHNEYQKGSSGKTFLSFTPDPNKSFNRGFTDYFLHGARKSIASFDTPKAVGERVGELRADHRGRLVYNGNVPIANGDGLCFMNGAGNLEGFLVNKVEGNVLVPHKPVDLRGSVPLFRNQDVAFDRQLSGHSSERKIAVRMLFKEVERGFLLTVQDEDGITATAMLDADKEAAQKPEMALKQLRTSLSKLGNSPFVLSQLEVASEAYFLSPSVVNRLRNEAVGVLQTVRVEYFRPKSVVRRYAPEKMFEQADCKRNVTNSLSEQVYRDFGAREVVRGLDETQDFRGKELMVCKHCLRFELGCCSKTADVRKAKLPWYLFDGRHRFRLEFDCQRCQMKIICD